MTKGKRIAVCALLIWGLMVLGIGGSFAKYQASQTQEFPFVVRTPGTFLVTQPEDESLQGWQMQKDGSYRIGFRITNQAEEDGDAFESDLWYTVKIAITGGLEQGEVFLVSRNPVGVERIYKATKKGWAEDTVQYQQMGEGSYCYFYDEDDNELVWKLNGGTVSGLDYMIELRGVTQPGMMEIIITEAAAED